MNYSDYDFGQPVFNNAVNLSTAGSICHLKKYQLYQLEKCGSLAIFNMNGEPCVSYSALPGIKEKYQKLKNEGVIIDSMNRTLN